MAKNGEVLARSPRYARIIPWEVRETLYNMLLSKRQKEILIGTILGDGHLEKNGNGIRLRVDHGMNQSEYLKWKFKEFENLATNKPRVVRAFHKRNNKFYEH